jgi:hypothetical protein
MPLKQSKSPLSSKCTNLNQNNFILSLMITCVGMNKIKAMLRNLKLKSQLRETIRKSLSANVNAGRETKNLLRKAKL